MIDEWEGYIGLKWLDPILTQRGKIDIFISVFQIISQEWGNNMNLSFQHTSFLNSYSLLLFHPQCLFSFLFNTVFSKLNFLLIWFSFFQSLSLSFYLPNSLSIPFCIPYSIPYSLVLIFAVYPFSIPCHISLCVLLSNPISTVQIPFHFSSFS